MNQRTLIAIAISFLIIFGWQQLFVEPKKPQSSPPSQSAKAPTGGKTQGKEAPAALQEGGSEVKSSELKPSSQPAMVRLGLGEAVLAPENGMLQGWVLENYLVGEEEKKSADLFFVTHQKKQIELAFDHADFSYLSTARGRIEKTSNGTRWFYEDSKIRIVREVSGSPEQPWANLTVSADFKSEAPTYAFLSLFSAPMKDDPESHDRKLSYFSGGSFDYKTVERGMELEQIPQPVKWIGMESRYFILSLVNQSAVATSALVQPTGTGVRGSLIYPVTGKSFSASVRVYFGPKQLDILKQVEPTMDHAVDFGWFSWIAYPLLRLLKWFYEITGNYGVAIILLTILVRILVFPLNYKSMKSMRVMAKLQPMIQKIKDKHKSDPQKMNAEMLQLMRSQGYNPMSGCFPILIQMPVFFALYRVLYSSFELYNAPFMLWIMDLSAKDPFYVTPILMTAVMFLQQKLTPTTATDPVQQKMITYMPVIFGVFMLWLPSGLTLYMLTSTVAGIFQQLFINKKLGLTPLVSPTPEPAKAVK